jgi:hypothetical protein
MSEPQTEPVEPVEEPQGEPVAPPDEEPDGDDDDEADAAAGDTEAPTGDEPQGFSEKELEAGRRKLEAEGTRHRNRVSEILGEEAQLLVPCELCSGFVDGLRFPVLPPQDVIEAVRIAIGMPDLSNYQPAKSANQCPDCAGLGVVLSGSLVPENAAITCQTCHGSGYVMRTATGEITGPTVFTNGAEVPDVPVGVNPDDPAVKELRARGFTIFPPVNLPQGAGV